MVKVYDCQSRFTLQYTPYGFIQLFIPFQRNQHSPEVVAEDSFVMISLRLNCAEVDLALNHLIKPPLRQVRVTAKKREKLLDLGFVFEWRAVTVVQFGDLIEREIFEGEFRADIERRLIQIS